jgi:hypothetical protein
MAHSPLTKLLLLVASSVPALVRVALLIVKAIPPALMTVRVAPEEILNEDEVFMDTRLAKAVPEESEGGVVDDEMITSSDAVGTPAVAPLEGVQLPTVFQLLLTEPFQVLIWAERFWLHKRTTRKYNIFFIGGLIKIELVSKIKLVFSENISKNTITNLRTNLTWVLSKKRHSLPHFGQKKRGRLPSSILI